MLRLSGHNTPLTLKNEHMVRKVKKKNKLVNIDSDIILRLSDFNLTSKVSSWENCSNSYKGYLVCISCQRRTPTI